LSRPSTGRLSDGAHARSTARRSGARDAPLLRSFLEEGDMRRILYVLALGVLGGGVALADHGDKGFVDKAAAGGTAEVKLSKLAMDKGQSPEVKQFARKMVEDHTKANMELKQIAEKKSLNVPTAMDEKHQKIYDKLVKLQGNDFDKQYMQAMADDHDDTVKLFKDQAQNGQDPELKSFAMKTLPTLQKHDDMVHMDERQMGNMPNEKTKDTMPPK
jgi:putative membrane protein